MNKSRTKAKTNIIPYNSNNNIRFSTSHSSKKNNSNNKNSFDNLTQKKTNKEINSNPINIKYGERLYHKGIAYKKITESKIQKLKKNLLDSKLNQCTFKPKTLKVRVISVEKINNNNKNIVKLSHDYNNLFQKSLSDSNINNNTEGYNISLNNITKNSNLNNNYYINKNKINKTNLSIPKPTNLIKKNKKKLNSYNTSLKLYNDGKKLKQKRKEEIEKYFHINYPFKPKISKSQESVKAKSSFFSRLQKWINNLTRKQIKLQEESLYDSQTGFRLFSPNIIKTNYSNFHIFSSKEKCLKLFDESKERKKKIQIEEKKLHDNLYKMANSTFFSPRSRILIDNLMNKIFRKIFFLISINGNFIDNNNIDLENINIKVSEIFLPLFQELENNNLIMYEEDFVKTSFNFYKKMNIYQKNILIEWYFNLMKKEKRNNLNLQKKNISFRNRNYNNLMIYTETNTIFNRDTSNNNTILTNDFLYTNTLLTNDFINNTNTIITNNENLNTEISNIIPNDIENNQNKDLNNKEKTNHDICTFRPLSNQSTSRISKNIDINSPSNNNQV